MLHQAVELRQLRYAIAVADELHFTRAATKLHVTQSALTRQIRQLELLLGVDLFVRDTRRVELTDAGRAFVDEGRKALALIERGVMRARGAGRRKVETVRIAYSPFVDAHFFAGLRKVFEEAWPDAKMEYISEPVMRQIEGLLNGSLDAGIGGLPIHDDALASLCLFQEPVLVVLPTSHRLTRKRHVQAPELADDPVIWMPKSTHPALHDEFLQWCRAQGYEPNIVQYVTTVAETLAFVAEGIGVGFVKASAQRLHADGLVFRSLGKPPFVVSTGVIYRVDNRSEMLKEFLKRASARLPADQSAKFRTGLVDRSFKKSDSGRQESSSSLQNKG